LRFKIPYFHKPIGASRDDLFPEWWAKYISLENATQATDFSCPLKHLTSDGSSAVAMVLMSPLASSMTVYISNY
jgi:hypothetical protein